MYPPIDVFEDVADPADWELIAAAEAKTNPRVRAPSGACRPSLTATIGSHAYSSTRRSASSITCRER